MIDIYYIERVGVYRHGVYWIGHDIQQAFKSLASLADSDVDDYHTWELMYHCAGQAAFDAKRTQFANTGFSPPLAKKRKGHPIEPKQGEST